MMLNKNSLLKNYLIYEIFFSVMTLLVKYFYSLHRFYELSENMHEYLISCRKICTYYNWESILTKGRRGRGGGGVSTGFFTKGRISINFKFSVFETFKVVLKMTKFYMNLDHVRKERSSNLQKHLRFIPSSV